MPRRRGRLLQPGARAAAKPEREVFHLRFLHFVTVFDSQIRRANQTIDMTATMLDRKTGTVSKNGNATGVTATPSTTFGMEPFTGLDSFLPRVQR